MISTRAQAATKTCPQEYWQYFHTAIFKYWPAGISLPFPILKLHAMIPLYFLFKLRSGSVRCIHHHVGIRMAEVFSGTGKYIY